MIPLHYYIGAIGYIGVDVFMYPAIYIVSFEVMYLAIYMIPFMNLQSCMLAKLDYETDLNRP